MIIALSYSRISDYRACPLKFKLKYIDKKPNFYDESQKGPHLIRGGNVHDSLKNYVVKKKAGENPIPQSTLLEVERTKPLIDGIMSLYDYFPEHQIAINSNFELVDWYSKDAYFRMIADGVGFGKDLLLTDYKTGKLNNYAGSMGCPGQLHFSALIGFSVWPQFELCKSLYIYVDHKQVYSESFCKADHYEILKERLIDESNLINADKEFHEKHNQFCKWCMSTKDQCKFSKNA